MFWRISLLNLGKDSENANLRIGDYKIRMYVFGMAFWGWKGLCFCKRLRNGSVEKAGKMVEKENC